MERIGWTGERWFAPPFPEGLGCPALDDMPFLGSQLKFLTAKEEEFVK